MQETTKSQKKTNNAKDRRAVQARAFTVLAVLF
jgi:hypothetical protein